MTLLRIISNYGKGLLSHFIPFCMFCANTRYQVSVYRTIAPLVFIPIVIVQRPLSDINELIT